MLAFREITSRNLEFVEGLIAEITLIWENSSANCHDDLRTSADRNSAATSGRHRLVKLKETR